ncbi:MAG: TRAP transporter small permease [Ectothiorhodospiraceae bacterium]|nr:TRAP transporter small permease [Chromatiales bacterium]MCP5157095.1 TRAP transporter small permease [Ectothiorhodospiraceae bacterium]
MRKLLAIVDGISYVAAGLAALLGLSIAVMILSEVVARSLLNISLSFAWEYSAYAMGVGMFAGCAYTLRTGGHIRVSLLSSKVPPRVAHWVDVACTLIGVAVSGFVARALVDLALRSWASGSTAPTVSATPLVIPQGAIALGAVLLTLQLVARLVRLLTGEPPEDQSTSFQVE